MPMWPKKCPCTVQLGRRFRRLKSIKMVFYLSFILAEVYGAKLQHEVHQYTYEVVNQYPHDNNDFLQGFYMESADQYIESTGLYGESKLQRVSLYDNEKIKVHELDDVYFGEGCVQFRDKIYQLTWKERTIFVYDAETLEPEGTIAIPPEMEQGWGLATDGNVIYAVDGTEKIYIIEDPETFKVTEILQVKLDGKMDNINELEFIDGELWANVFYEHFILKINPRNGVVNGVIDMTGLEAKDEYETWMGGDVLNGIAVWEDRIFVSGKRWNHIYEVKIVPL